MESLSSIGEAIRTIVVFDRENYAKMPPEVQAEFDRLIEYGTSPVERIVETTEILFAHRNKLTRNKDREAVAQLAEFASRPDTNFGGMSNGNRGAKIKAAMLALAGGPAVAAKDIPDVLDKHKEKLAAPPVQPIIPAPSP